MGWKTSGSLFLSFLFFFPCWYAQTRLVFRDREVFGFRRWDIPWYGCTASTPSFIHLESDVRPLTTPTDLKVSTKNDNYFLKSSPVSFSLFSSRRLVPLVASSSTKSSSFPSRNSILCEFHNSSISSAYLLFSERILKYYSQVVYHLKSRILNLLNVKFLHFLLLFLFCCCLLPAAIWLSVCCSLPIHKQSKLFGWLSSFLLLEKCRKFWVIP